MAYIFYAVLLQRKTRIKNHGNADVSERHTDECNHQISTLSVNAKITNKYAVHINKMSR